MRETAGSSRVRGRLGYVAQQSWIFSGTVRDNICLGSTYEPAWFSQVVEVCGLTRDLQILQDGDLTEVGERGLTLSGGQKQRVSLARALYSRADIFLLDDPLSAVDARVGQFIFRRAIKECLRDKTVLLVSHGLQYLRDCDSVIFLQEGRIVESGSPADLLARPGGHLAGLAGFDQERDGADPVVGAASNQGAAEVGQEEEEPGIPRRDSQEPVSRSNSWAPLFRYLREAGHPLEFTVIFTFLFLFILIRLSSAIFLKRWLDAGDGLEEERRQNGSFYNMTDTDTVVKFKGFINDNPDLWQYQLGYAMIILGMLCVGLVKVCKMIYYDTS